MLGFISINLGKPCSVRLNDLLGHTFYEARSAMTTNETRRCEWCGDIAQGECGCTAEAEIARLTAEVAELDALRDKLADILRRTAVALRGPEPPLTMWSWHDLPERASASIVAIDIMQRAAKIAANGGQRKPLDHDSAHAVFEGWYHDDAGGVEFVRRVEAAHGICEA